MAPVNVTVSRGWLEDLLRICRTLIDLHEQDPTTAQEWNVWDSAWDRVWVELADRVREDEDCQACAGESPHHSDDCPDWDLPA